LVLAGGLARRLGGSKALRTVGGVAMLERVLRLAREVSDELLLLRGERELDVPGTRHLADAPGVPGPMGAVLSGLSQARHAWCLLLPCDLPYGDAALVERLRDVAKHTSADAVLLEDPHGLQPFHGLYRTAPARAAAEAYAASGGRALRGWIDRLELARVPAPADGLPLLDVDTPADLARARRLSPS